MSDLSELMQAVRRNLAQDGVRFHKGTTTSGGAAGGTTVVDSTLTGNANAWQNCQVELLAGAFTNVRRTVESSSGTTLTFTNNAFPYQVPTSLAFEMYESGAFSGHELRGFIIDAANFILSVAERQETIDYELTATSGGVVSGAYAYADLPASMLRINKWPEIDGKELTILDEGNVQWFQDPDLTATGANYVGQYIGRSSTSTAIGRLRYKPAENKDVTFNYLPLVTGFDTSGNWKVPPALEHKIAPYATGLCLQANDMMQQADRWFNQVAQMLPSENVTKGQQ